MRCLREGGAVVEYISTRGKARRLNFAEASLAGLADDGGLYVPQDFPKGARTGKSYLETVFAVMQPFVGSSFSPEELKALIADAYKVFPGGDVAPLRRLEENFHVMELFHGPTLAFKDVALQFLGRVFERLLSRNNARVTIVGATSGDTGSAAIEAFRNSRHADIFILHPKGRVSEVQRRQMTTVLSPNVFNIAVEGTFDDCQNLVKAMFADVRFRADIRLSAVNSINWARVLAQAVYYAHAAAQFKNPVAFCVPTGNFGNIYAGYVAREMGFGVRHLIAATNRNDILHRFFTTGCMEKKGVAPSLSPSMDIEISSNFERLLFELYDRDGGAVEKTLQGFRDGGAFTLDQEKMRRVGALFSSGRRDDAQTIEVIRRIHEKYGYVVDPHTAVGLGVAEEWRKKNPEIPVLSLATAHPAKFPGAVRQATGKEPELPPFLADILSRREECADLPYDLEKVQAFIRQRVKK